MGVKLFVSGEIAYAADVNEFLMEQSIAKFANIAARNVAFGDGTPIAQGGDGKPLLKEGQFCYLEDNSLASNGSGTPEVQFYNGTNWVGAENFAVSDGEITDVKVNAAAAIQISKLAAGTSGQIMVCNSSGVPTYVTLSGDATISNTGVLTVGGNTVALGTDTTGDYVATITGTANQITVTGSGSETAAVTLALPQNIHTAANPTFAGLTADAVQIGITTANEIDTTTGNLVLDSTGGTVTVDDILSVSGSAAISGAASVAGLFTAAGNATVSGSAAITGNIVYHLASSAVSNSGSITTAMDGQLIELGTVSGAVGLHYVGGTGWTVGSQVTLMQMSGTASTSASIVFPGSQTVRGTPVISSSVAVLRAQYSSATIINRGTNDWFIIGDLKS